MSKKDAHKLAVEKYKLQKQLNKIPSDAK